ncbi:hypothetical protein KKG52_04075 [Patescibacteria group bacterium]|nr:hypothetical protein [Patescibacteria group bacterium]
MKFNEQLKKYLKNLIVKMLANRLAKFTFIILVWVISLELLDLIGLLSKVDSNLLIIANLAMFFFALTASPTTWVIKGPFGFEAGSNDPKHTHVTFNENSHQGQVDVREYGDKKDFDRLITISNQLKKKI